MGFADKSRQKIEDRHLFEDCKPSSDRVGSKLGKILIEDLIISKYRYSKYSFWV